MSLFMIALQGVEFLRRQGVPAPRKAVSVLPECDDLMTIVRRTPTTPVITPWPPQKRRNELAF